MRTVDFSETAADNKFTGELFNFRMNRLLMAA